MTLAEILDRLRCSRSSVYAWMTHQQFPEPVKLGSTSRWLRTEVDAWIQRQAAVRVRR